jgi:hypothetical protein
MVRTVMSSSCWWCGSSSPSTVARTYWMNPLFGWSSSSTTIADAKYWVATAAYCR